LWKEYNQELEARRETFGLVNVVYQRDESLVEGREIYYLDAKLGVWVRKGAGMMGGEKRGKVEVVRQRITEIYLKCYGNIRENKEAMWFSAEEYGGVQRVK
jgi:hypothetical protein